LRTLIDTSVAVALREGEAAILARAELLQSPALLSILSVVELEGGVSTAPEGAAVRRAILDEMYGTLDILPFFEREAAAYRRTVEICGFSRRLIVDRMIAATALANDLLLATLNPRLSRRAGASAGGLVGRLIRLFGAPARRSGRRRSGCRR
jgi:predicted nucleic acid-binding protein